ncbi:MAG TPA: M23 family metallopeptidase [Thermoanaerobaculia bacterium]|nr:M23 family metallopeptidase [Thermoanaerobaculia bacterium]
MRWPWGGRARESAADDPFGSRTVSDPPLGPRRGRLEIQIHPASIRRRVRYLFVGRALLTAWCLLGLAYLLFLAYAAFLAPDTLRALFSGGEYQGLAAERAQQGERLQDLVRRLEQLGARGEELGLRMAKVELAYGLPPAGPSPASPVAAAAGRNDPELRGSIYAGLIQQGDRLRLRLGTGLRAVDGQLRRLNDFEARHPERVRVTPSICPLRGSRFVLTSPFARQRSPFTRELTFHPGIDLAAPRGAPIHAAADGRVAFAGQLPLGRSVVWWRYGNLVALQHGDDLLTLYGHCDTVAVRAGQTVRRGQLLGTVGSTGWSPNPHLHYEVRRRVADGPARAIDPRLFILDVRWPNEERLLARAGEAPDGAVIEPLPAALLR